MVPASYLCVACNAACLKKYASKCKNSKGLTSSQAWGVALTTTMAHLVVGALVGSTGWTAEAGGMVGVVTVVVVVMAAVVVAAAAEIRGCNLTQRLFCRA